MKKILEKINEYDVIILHGHVKPDGDCYGSQFGLKEVIKLNFPNKKVYAVGQVCEYIDFLGEMDIIDDEVFSDALSIIVDSGNEDRISDQRFKLSSYVIKIDHHLEVDPYGDYRYVDEKASATCEIITQMVMECDLELNKEAATALYTGIVTDSGRFRYDSVSEKTFVCASRLIKHGVSLAYIDSKLSVDSFESLKLKGYVLNAFKVSKNGFAYVKITRDIVEKYHVTDEQAASMVNVISTIATCPVWALIIEYKDSTIRVRLRSKGPDVNLLAQEYNGGGHKKASGASLNSWDDLKLFVKKADKLVYDYKQQK